MKTILCLVLVFTCYFSNAQRNPFDIVAGTGLYLSSVHGKATESFHFTGEFEYHYNRKLSFAAGLITAQYFFEDPNGYRTVNNKIVSQGTELQSNFLVKFKIIQLKRLTLQVGAGAGLITYGKEVKIINRNPQSYFYIHESNTDLGFPISIELYKTISKRFLIGIKYGTFIYPDYPIVGNNIGLQTRLRI